MAELAAEATLAAVAETFELSDSFLAHCSAQDYDEHVRMQIFRLDRPITLIEQLVLDRTYYMILALSEQHGKEGEGNCMPE